MDSPGTLRQFANGMRDRYCAENPELSKAEYERYYPRVSRIGLWSRICRDFARFGGTFTRYELDDIFSRDERFGWGLRHDYPGCFPVGYIPPTIRHSRS